MAGFMNEDILLTTRAARRLYNDHARDMPIFDYHCHLPVRDIAENRGFRSLTEAWLGGDHYKWRAMRASGVAERLITGDAPDREKFMAWASVIPATVGNPLYSWSHLELKRYFGITGAPLGPTTADRIYQRCNGLLARDDYRVRSLLTRMNVRVVCTTDDPVDTLEHHARLASDASFPVTVVPTFRPDAALGVENPGAFNTWVQKLAGASGVAIDGWKGLVEALRRRHAAFHEAGCRASDHGIEEPYVEECSENDAERVFRHVRSGTTPDPRSARQFKSAVMLELGRMDGERGWVQQLHMGALRDINTRFLRSHGPNSGFDTIGDFRLARPLARWLDLLDREGRLPKTILYCLNPADNAVLATAIGSFPQEGVSGKMQFGPAWWFNDQRHGMEEQLRVFAETGVLGRFVGMLTDSRSFLSFPRHEYFRRVLCAMLGNMMEAGEAPMDFGHIGGIVRDICWRNAEGYFGVPLKRARGEA
jgi:glucuronate isomerase